MSSPFGRSADFIIDIDESPDASPLLTSHASSPAGSVAVPGKSIPVASEMARCMTWIAAPCCAPDDFVAPPAISERSQ